MMLRWTRNLVAALLIIPGASLLWLGLVVGNRDDMRSLVNDCVLKSLRDLSGGMTMATNRKMNDIVPDLETARRMATALLRSLYSSRKQLYTLPADERVSIAKVLESLARLLRTSPTVYEGEDPEKGE